jgi:hypothetical protein
MVDLDPPVVLPDLTIAPGERRGVAHLDRGLREVYEEDILVGGIELDEVSSGGAADEEHLVGAEEDAVDEDVLVVLVVKLEGRLGVKEKEVSVTPSAGSVGVEAPRRTVKSERLLRVWLYRCYQPEACALGVADGVVNY